MHWFSEDSAVVAGSLLRNLNNKILDYDYHLHFQYLSLKKDGPSWGLACFILLCLLTDTKMKEYCNEGIIAATGELDLSGMVKPVKYLKEKVEGMIPYVNCKNIFIPFTEEIISIEGKCIYQVRNITELLVL